MPEMDGLELTVWVRQLDESINHYTYIVLLTGKEGENVSAEGSLDRGVDDFVSKAAMNEQLVPRIYAADRLCNTLQRLLVENRLLTEKHRADGRTQPGGYPHWPRQSSLPAPGSWPMRLRQVETRGGALCYLGWSALFVEYRSCASGTARPSIASCCSAWPGACNSWSGCQCAGRLDEQHSSP